MGSITLFFFQMGILDMIQHFMHEILIGSSQYFTSYCIESSHLCEILKSGRLGWAVKVKKFHFVDLRVTYLGKCGNICFEFSVQ